MENSQQSEKPGTYSGCWDFFDKIYCISVDDRSDRRDEAKKQFHRIGLLDRVEFVIVKKHPTNREQGIYESHITCLRKGIQANANNIMVFEDDIIFERFKAADLQRSVDFLWANANWNVFFLGCLVKKSKRTKIRSVLNVKYRSLSHAYVLNRGFAETLVRKPWQGVPIDSMLSRFEEGFYAIYPSFAFQRSSRSDNNEYLVLDKVRMLCGGLRRIQKMDELYHRNKTFIIAAHIFLMILVVWTVS